MLTDLDRLRLETATLSELTASGRTLRGRSPERKPGPRMSLVRSWSGSLVWLRHDVDDQPASAIDRLAGSEAATSVDVIAVLTSSQARWITGQVLHGGGGHSRQGQR